MGRTEALVRAQQRYAGKTRQVKITFIQGADDDILERLDQVGSKVDYLRRLIRADIAENE